MPTLRIAITASPLPRIPGSINMPATRLQIIGHVRWIRISMSWCFRVTAADLIIVAKRIELIQIIMTRRIKLGQMKLMHVGHPRSGANSLSCVLKHDVSNDQIRNAMACKMLGSFLSITWPSALRFMQQVRSMHRMRSRSSASMFT